MRGKIRNFLKLLLIIMWTDMPRLTHKTRKFAKTANGDDYDDYRMR